jgi:hypothetical protein
MKSEATPAIAEGLYRIPRLFSGMQTGTTPARRTVTEPASDRSAAPTGSCRTPTTPTATPATVSAGVDPTRFAEVAA